MAQGRRGIELPAGSAAVGAVDGTGFDLLLGRRTYDLSRRAFHVPFSFFSFFLGQIDLHYSHFGNRFAIVVFALERARIAVRHYVPGLAEWTTDTDAPIAAGRKPE